MPSYSFTTQPQKTWLSISPELFPTHAFSRSQWCARRKTQTLSFYVYVQEHTRLTLGDSRSQHLTPGGSPVQGPPAPWYPGAWPRTGAHFLLRHLSPRWRALGTAKSSSWELEWSLLTPTPILILSPGATKTIYNLSQSLFLFLINRIATTCSKSGPEPAPSTCLLWRVREVPPSPPGLPSECCRDMLPWTACGCSLHLVWPRAGGHRTLALLHFPTLTLAPLSLWTAISIVLHSFQKIPEDLTVPAYFEKQIKKITPIPSAVQPYMPFARTVEATS